MKKAVFIVVVSIAVTPLFSAYATETTLFEVSQLEVSQQLSLIYDVLRGIYIVVALALGVLFFMVVSK